MSQPSQPKQFKLFEGEECLNYKQRLAKSLGAAHGRMRSLFPGEKLQDIAEERLISIQTKFWSMVHNVEDSKYDIKELLEQFGEDFEAIVWQAEIGNQAHKYHQQCMLVLKRKTNHKINILKKYFNENKYVLLQKCKNPYALDIYCKKVPTREEGPFIWINEEFQKEQADKQPAKLTVEDIKECTSFRQVLQENHNICPYKIGALKNSWIELRHAHHEQSTIDKIREDWDKIIETTGLYDWQKDIVALIPTLTSRQFLIAAGDGNVGKTEFASYLKLKDWDRTEIIS